MPGGSWGPSCSLVHKEYIDITIHLFLCLNEALKYHPASSRTIVGGIMVVILEFVLGLVYSHCGSNNHKTSRTTWLSNPPSPPHSFWNKATAI